MMKMKSQGITLAIDKCQPHVALDQKLKGRQLDPFFGKHKYNKREGRGGGQT